MNTDKQTNKQNLNIVLANRIQQYTEGQNRVHSKDAILVQYSKSNQFNPPHRQAKEEKKITIILVNAEEASDKL